MAPARPAEPPASGDLHGAHVVVQPPAGSDDGQWLAAAKDPANLRFSGLADIRADNVRTMVQAWSFPTHVLRGHEGAPLVVGDTMYLVTPFPNLLYALDLTRPGANVKWVYRPAPVPAAQGEACCDVVNRGAAYADGTIFYNTLDTQTVAVDARTGRERWRTLLGDIHHGETMTMAPIVVRNHVLVGNSGGEFGARGWLAALDTHDGHVAWRAYSTGPDADVLIGASFRPFYASDRGRDLGVTSWPTERWRQGGGTVWGWLSYDPELDLVYYGTANPSPWNHEQRAGDNKWTAGLFARRPDTGEAIWFYQLNPHDLFDYDGVNESVLVDLEWNGARRRVLIHPDRNGYVYVMDRATGEVLSASPFVHVTTTAGVDLATGRPREVDTRRPISGRTVRDICPAAPGGKDWQPSAFSPQTGLLYIPHNNLCQDEQGYEANYIAGTPYVGADVRMYPGPGGHAGAFTAWDPIAGRAVWSIPEHFPVWSGALVTAGNVVFYGTMDGWFKALDARTGELLWKYRTPSGIIGQPITYRAPDGRQYVAIFSGVGGWSGAVVSAQLDTRDQTAALGFANATSDLSRGSRREGELHVFALP